MTISNAVVGSSLGHLKNLLRRLQECEEAPYIRHQRRRGRLIPKTAFGN